MVGDCEPLIQIHATTTETIALQEIRSSDELTASVGGDNDTPLLSSPSTEDNGNNNNKTDRILLERITETTGYRYLSIRPALYEKVSVFQNTPS